MSSNVYKLSDSTIAQIVQLIQMGILTGTDISDHVRTLRVIPSDNGYVEPDPDFVQTFEDTLERMSNLNTSNE